MSFADTVTVIKEQGGLVYLPHPFDRMHSIPDPATLQRHLADIDVFEVYNARLLFEAYNDEALRFARKYSLTMGAGSDAHVLQGVGTGRCGCGRFDGPKNSSSASAAQRFCGGQVARYLQWAEVGGPGQGTGPLGREPGSRRP